MARPEGVHEVLREKSEQRFEDPFCPVSRPRSQRVGHRRVEHYSFQFESASHWVHTAWYEWPFLGSRPALFSQSDHLGVRADLVFLVWDPFARTSAGWSVNPLLRLWATSVRPRATSVARGQPAAATRHYRRRLRAVRHHPRWRRTPPGRPRRPHASPTCFSAQCSPACSTCSRPMPHHCGQRWVWPRSRRRLWAFA